MSVMEPVARRASPKLALVLALTGLGTLALTAACTKDRPASTPRVSLLDPGPRTGTHRTPAIWRYHPKKEASLGTRLDLPNGQILLAGDRGERWLADKKTGSVRAAARLAPERVVAIMQREEHFAFVGQSGTSYEATSPLGPFVRSSAPLDALAKVEAAASVIVGITRRGGLVQSSDGGAAWRDADAAADRFVDVVLTRGGAGLALAIPEALFATQDRGASWKKLDVAPVGAVRLVASKDEKIAIDSALGARQWDPANPGTLTPLAALPSRQRYQLTKPPPRGPDAAALMQGRALVLQGEYLEVAPAEGKGNSGQWLLWRGPIDGDLKSSPLDAAKSCSTLRIAGFEKNLALLCAARAIGAQHELTLITSTDRGASFTKQDDTMTGRLAELSVVVAQGGQLVVTGVCAPTAGSRGCSPFGVYHRRKVDPETARAKLKKATKLAKQKPKVEAAKSAGEASHELALSATPSLERVALALAVSHDGATVYAVGKRTKGSLYAVYVSRDGGRTFESNEIPELTAPTVVDDDEEHHSRFARPARPSSTTELLQLSAADDGTVSMVFRESQSQVIALADAEGRLVQLTRPPTEAQVLGAIGARALALSSGSGRAWESLDGGATWDPIGKLPVEVCEGSGRCEVALHCTSRACVVGSELSRIGWRGQADDDQGVLSPPEERERKLFDRRVRTPLSCTLSEAPWQPLAGVTEIPNASHAALGKTGWFAVTSDPASGSATLIRANLGAKGKLESQALFGPVARPADHALYVSTQVEGAAAVRYLTAEASRNGRLTHVEVVWENLLEGRLLRGKLVDGGVYVPGDYSKSGAGAEAAQVDLVSISAAGLYLRLHKSPRDRQATHFFDGRGVTEVPAVDWPSTSLSTRVTEMVHVGGRHVPMRILQDGAVVLVGRQSGKSFTFDALTAGLPTPRDFGLTLVRDLTYVNGAPALHLLQYDPSGSERKNLVFPISASGAALGEALAVASQLDLADPPKRCGAVARKEQPRVVVPFQGGSRHPLVVSDGAEPTRLLLSASAVLHGTPEDPCLAALDAEQIALDPSDDDPRLERALVILDDLEHAWLFRLGNPSGGRWVEVRGMSCRFDPSAEVPIDVYGAPGTLIQRGG